MAMGWMTRKGMIRSLDAARIEQAIADAERGTAGEIRVSVAPLFWGSVRHTAERAFERLGMTNTKQRNGVLLFIVPARRKFVVLGDAGIHACVGDCFWNELAEILSEAFAAGRYNDGLVEAIEHIGQVLAREFPAGAGHNPDELSNAVDFADGQGT